MYNTVNENDTKVKLNWRKVSLDETSGNEEIANMLADKLDMLIVILLCFICYSGYGDIQCELNSSILAMTECSG